MSETTYRLPGHREVVAMLSRLDRTFLARSQCYFGGGTRIVLDLGEYRESRGVYFQSSSRDGYRLLRETVSESSLGGIAGSGLALAREVRADQYGIRTFVEHNGTRLKFEIVREARIEIAGQEVAGIPFECLTRRHCFAEKFLANADRGMDPSTLSRDLVDLAFMIEAWPGTEAKAGIELAERAYGGSVRRALASAVKKLREDKAWRKRCVEGLAITDTKVMIAGIKTLELFAAET